MKTVVLITDAFPYSSITENSFISPEIESLSKSFDRVIIAPRKKMGDKVDMLSFPNNVEISDAMLIDASLKNKIKGIIGKSKAIAYDILHSHGNLREILAYTSFVGISVNNIKRLIKEKNIDIDNTLFYTFWFDFTTAALTYFPEAKFITRAHGHDLYEDHYFISSWWRIATLKKMLKCYCISKAGTNYLSNKYPEYSCKIDCRLLGTTRLGEKSVPQHEKDTTASSLTLVGIARVSPEKGVIRQVEFVKKFAKYNPEIKIEYIHIGDGPLMKKLQELSNTSPDNLRIELKGSLHNSEVHKFLLSTDIDALLLLSYTEGLPFVLCEAISYGIPYIATNVGGIKEIVPESLLPLVSEKCSFTEFNSILKSLSSSPKLNYQLKEYWKKTFDAEKLRSQFTMEIRKLIE